MRHEEHGDSERADDLRDLCAQRLAQERVDVRPRLVQQHQLGRGSERACERDALLLSAGELVRIAAFEPVETDDREQLGHAACAHAAGKSEADVARDGEVREQRVVLEDHPDTPRLRRDPGRGGGDDPTVDRHAAAVGALEARDQP